MNLKEYLKIEYETYTHIHPWKDFLHYRSQCILWLKNEHGKSDEQIAQMLSMDEIQVSSILSMLG